MIAKAIPRKRLLLFLLCFLFSLHILLTKTYTQGRWSLSLPQFGPRSQQEQKIIDQLQKQVSMLNEEGNDETYEGLQIFDDRAYNLSCREYEINVSSAEIQGRIRMLQNPQDCPTAKKLFCNYTYKYN